MGAPRDSLPPHLRDQVEAAEAREVAARKKTGKRTDMIIMDDPYGPTSQMSKKKLRAWFKKNMPIVKPEVDPVFAALLKRCDMPLPVMEHKFHKHGRAWRFDMAWLYHKIAVEIDGGIDAREPGHTWADGIRRDMEKGNEAQRLGWWFIRVEPKQLRQMATIDLIADLMGI